MKKQLANESIQCDKILLEKLKEKNKNDENKETPLEENNTKESKNRTTNNEENKIHKKRFLNRQILFGAVSTSLTVKFTLELIKLQIIQA